MLTKTFGYVLQMLSVWTLAKYCLGKDYCHRCIFCSKEGIYCTHFLDHIIQGVPELARQLLTVDSNIHSKTDSAIKIAQNLLVQKL